MDTKEKDCENHENHLCDLTAKRKMDTVAALAKGAAHLCRICGRAAKDPDNLCEPIELG